MILELNEKEIIKLNFSMKKIIEITKKYKSDIFKDLFFKKMNNVDFEFLATIIMSFIEKSESNYEINGDINRVYDFLESYVEKNNTDYASLYSEVAEALNVKSFFGKKMSKVELEKEMNNPLAGFDINEVMNNTAEKIMGEVVAEEFKGYRG